MKHNTWYTGAAAGAATSAATAVRSIYTSAFSLCDVPVPHTTAQCTESSG